MKTVYFVRHGESASNAGGPRLGDATPLTEIGKKQADVVALRASKLPIDLIISSTMERAKDTARAISEKTGKAVDYSELFVERIWPSWFIGLSHNDPRVVEAEKEMIENFTVSGYRRDDGENFEDLKKRAILALQHIKERKEENIVVVTHGMFLRVMLAAVIYGSDLSAHECDRMLGGMITKNTGVSVIKESDKWISGWHLYVYNDHAHLAE